VEYELRVTRNLKWFDGHFPGNPILPGIVQIHWAIHFGGCLGFKPGGFKGIQRVKFKKIVRPDAILLLRLQSKPGKLLFSFMSDSSLHSEGAIEFAAHSADSTV
jgi:3-hydroxymyristoyl/3-hydroxydecanoyl-(acyl carrier protein) dehydratase